MMKYWPQRLLKTTLETYVPLAQHPSCEPLVRHFRETQLPYMSVEEADAYMKTDIMQSSIRVMRQYYAQGIEGHCDDMRVLTRDWGYRIEDVGYPGVRLWYGGADINTPPRMGLYLARRLPKSVYKEYEGETHMSLLIGDHFPNMVKELVRGDA
jgi:hypothetical protein